MSNRRSVARSGNSGDIRANPGFMRACAHSLEVCHEERRDDLTGKLTGRFIGGFPGRTITSATLRHSEEATANDNLDLAGHCDTSPLLLRLGLIYSRRIAYGVAG